MPFKTPHPVFQTTDTFQQLVDDLNTYGNTVDSNFHYVDSAVGPDAGSGFHLNGLLTTSGNLIDALNELDSDLHGGPGTFKALTTTEAKHVVGAINEIEAVFDASASTIDTTAGLTVTSAGTETHNITGDFNVNTSGSMDLDAGGDITLDADGNDIIFKDGASTRLQHTLGATNTITSTGNYTVDATGDITLDADGNDIIFKDGASTRLQHTFSGATNTITSTGNYTVDATGDITLDADGNDILFKNGADGDTVYHRIYATQQYHVEAPAGIKLTANDDTVIIEGSNTSSARATFDMDTSPTVTFTGSTNIGNTSGSFTIDAAQYAILDATLGRVYFQSAGVNKVTHFLDASTITAEIAGAYTVDATGDIILDADGADIIFKDGGVTAYNFSSAGTISRTGDIIIDASGDITLDADGQHIRFKDGGTTRLQYTMGTTNTVASTGHYTIDASGDITLAADGNDILFRDAASTRLQYTLGATNTVAYTGNLSQTSTGTYSQTATSYSSNVGAGTYNTTSGNQTHTVGGTHQINATGTVSHTSSGGAFNVTASGGNITLDASGDVVLDADGNDIIFKNGAGADQVKHTLADTNGYVVTYPAGVTHTQSSGDLGFNVPGTDVIFGDGTNERIRLNLDASPNITLTGTGASISNTSGNLLIDGVGDVELDAATGSVNFDKSGVQYAAIDKGTTGNEVIFRLAANVVGLTISSTNLSVPGVITLPASGTGTITSTEISANTVHGAIDEVNARIPNVYNRAGTLMNP
jgi:hypothetical protein